MAALFLCPSSMQALGDSLVFKACLEHDPYGLSFVMVLFEFYLLSCPCQNKDFSSVIFINSISSIFFSFHILNVWVNPIKMNKIKEWKHHCRILNCKSPCWLVCKTQEGCAIHIFSCDSREGNSHRTVLKFLFDTL